MANENCDGGEPCAVVRESAVNRLENRQQNVELFSKGLKGMRRTKQQGDVTYS